MQKKRGGKSLSKNTCVLCGSNDLVEYPAEFVPFLQERMFNNVNQKTELISCKKCDFVYSSYRPSQDEISRFYSGYRDAEYQKQRQNYEPAYSKEFNQSLGFSASNKSLREKTIAEVVYNHIAAKDVKRVLDFGGDAGQYIPDALSSAKKYVYDISGIQTVEGVKLITNKSELEKTGYDLVLCCHVLEHLSNPMESVQELMQMTAPEGYLYIEVPLEDNFKNLIAGNETSHVHEHINAYSTKTFEKLFENTGFEILENKVVEVKNDHTFLTNVICCLVQNKVAQHEYLVKYKSNQVAYLKDKLDIVMITWNRQKYLSKMLDGVFAENSPVRECSVTIIDNHSTDGTADYIKSLSEKHLNLKHIRNKYNVGGDPNLVKALEAVDKDKKYFWILTDDDRLDWTHWNEVQEAIVSDKYDIFHIGKLSRIDDEIAPSEIRKTAITLKSLTWIPGAFYRTSWLDSSVIQTAHYLSLFLFPILSIGIKIINNHGNVYSLPYNKSVVRHPDSYWLDSANDLFYTRGTTFSKILSKRIRMNFENGFLTALGFVNDPMLKLHCIDLLGNHLGYNLTGTLKEYLPFSLRANNLDGLVLLYESSSPKLKEEITAILENYIKALRAQRQMTVEMNKDTVEHIPFKPLLKERLKQKLKKLL